MHSLEQLTGASQHTLAAAIAAQRNEVERYVAACQEAATPRLAARLSELTAGDAAEAGDKAAVLAEVRNRVRLPVPDGFVLTTEAYRQFCGIPMWRAIRDALRDLDVNDAAALHTISEELSEMAMACPMPRSLEVAITERANLLDPGGLGLAVRSSGVGEGGEHTYAGQFLSLLNVPLADVVDAYKRVVAARFSEQALFYRLSTGLTEVESPMAVLVLPMIRARAAGVMYTRDPGDAKNKGLWITATRGLGPEIASGGTAADLFIVSRTRSYPVIESHLVSKDEEIVPDASGGLARRAVSPGEAARPSLAPEEIGVLAEYGARLEEYFGCPQDVEWVLDTEGHAWILQSRPLALVEPLRGASKARTREEPLLSGGRTVYPGRVSGPAWLAEQTAGVLAAPEGSIVFIRRPSPEIVQVFPRIGGLVAEWGNVTGHAAALLREFKVPSVFLLPGAFDRFQNGEPVSLDAAQRKLYRGTLFSPHRPLAGAVASRRARSADPISSRLLTLHLLDPAASEFRPSGCRSTHDVIRYCHEKAIEAMFTVNDLAHDHGGCARQLVTNVPMRLCVLDLGGGLTAGGPKVAPEEVLSRPFRAFWKGVTDPAVSWTREIPATLSDLVSVVTRSFTPQDTAMRALGERSYLLVAEEYMNLNSRLAYHYSLVDACLSDSPSKNYVALRFEGGGSTRERRDLRARFIQACLIHYGFVCDRRGDLVNAWFKKAPAEATEVNLNILGKMMACTSQLDMFMTDEKAMRWYVQQFLEGNYGFAKP